jgi:hypothetical protein
MAKPVTHQGDLAKLPRALAPLLERKHWCIWRWTKKPDGSWQKPPYVAMQPNRHASTSDSTTWTDYGTALAAMQAGHAEGLTYVLTADDPFAAIDLDHCRDEHGGIDIWAQLFLERSRNTYSEVTPSGAGCRIWGLANGEKLHRKFDLMIDGKPIAAELFRRTNKALTITGLKLDSIRELTSIDSVLEWAVIWGERRKAVDQAAEPAGTDFNGGGNGYSIDQIEALVRSGPPEGANRSDTFHMVVGHYLGLGYRADPRAPRTASARNRRALSARGPASCRDRTQRQEIRLQCLTIVEQRRLEQRLGTEGATAGNNAGAVEES